jgi:hypothetical protein
MNGIYGTIKSAYLTNSSIANDVDIYYSYRENRGDNGQGTVFNSLGSDCLVPATAETPSGTEILPGVFTLKLPLDKFGKAGVYSVYIKPKEIETIIQDIGVLSAYPDVRGIVLQTFTEDNSVLNVNGALTGYRVEYFGFNSTRSEDFSIITSSNKCSTIIQNIISTNQKAVRYRFDDTSNLIFCTVSPSTSPSFNANALPYIGRATETIRLVNTKFEPLLLEIEMVEHDEETISVMLEGNQIRNLDNGLITTYNFDNEIFRQHEYFTIKETTGRDLYDVKMDRGNDIDTSQDFNEITNAAR